MTIPDKDITPYEDQTKDQRFCEYKGQIYKKVSYDPASDEWEVVRYECM